MFCRVHYTYSNFVAMVCSEAENILFASEDVLCSNPLNFKKTQKRNYSQVPPKFFVSRNFPSVGNKKNMNTLWHAYKQLEKNSLHHCNSTPSKRILFSSRMMLYVVVHHLSMILAMIRAGE